MHLVCDPTFRGTMRPTLFLCAFVYPCLFVRFFSRLVSACFTSPSVLGREECLRVKLSLEDLKVGGASFRGHAHHAAVYGKDNVLECPVKLLFLKQQFPPHSCYFCGRIAEYGPKPKGPQHQISVSAVRRNAEDSSHLLLHQLLLLRE
jgi:hypothetical protein